ncbi:MAG: PEP-CTERM sorting domain-containing protein [Cyanobacteriota bacterium]|nr:PEP-CTERM sorting domain-containing protein [Cyanobacteriota bacterium]
MFARNAAAITISATASGSPTPQITTDGTPVVNGDFLIKPNSPTITPIVGDGVDESTTWTFDFTEDTNFPFFSTSGALRSAFLTLELAGADTSIITDTVQIEGLPLIVTDVIQELPLNSTSVVTLELLDFYSSNSILQAFESGEFGQLSMRYTDDAVVSFAKLELVSTPEPASALGLFTLGTLGTVSVLKRKGKES